MVALLEEETGADLSALLTQIERDVDCDIAVDSLSMVNIVVALEEAFGVKICESDITPESVRSLDAFAEILTDKVVVKDALVSNQPDKGRSTARSLEHAQRKHAAAELNVRPSLVAREIPHSRRKT